MDEQAIHLFTSITANYIPKARVLAHSAKQFHPNAQFHLILCDVIPDSVVLEKEPFDSIITVEELGIPDLQSWIFKHAIVEMCTGVKGIAFQTILDRYNAEKVFFFDPDMVILSPLDTLLEKLDQYSILLTPHQTVPEKTDDAIVDNEICSLKHGVFNLGFLGIRNSQPGREFIQWWRDRCLDYCYDDIPRGLFTDQKWVDLTPAFFSDYYVLRDPIYNVATWNLSHRQATGSLEEGIYINGEPICFYHFSGFDSGAQEIMLNKYGGKSPVLFELRQWYLQECDRCDQANLGKYPCYYATFDNGEKITQDQRLLYRYRKDLQQAYPNPFATSNRNQSYYHWFLDYGTKEYIPGRYNYFQNADDALIAAQNEIEELKTWIQAMESSKFWKLRQAWFWLKEKPQQFYHLLKNNGSSLQSTPETRQGIKRKVKNYAKKKLSHKPYFNLDLSQQRSQVNSLLRLSGEIKGVGNQAQLQHLILTVNDDSQQEIDIDQNSCFSVTINTFLLPNGENQLRLEARTKTGEILVTHSLKITVKNEGELAIAVKNCLEQATSSHGVITGQLDASHFPYETCHIIPWFNREDALMLIPEILEKYHLPQAWNPHLEQFVQEGYLHLDSLIDPNLIDQINHDIDDLITKGKIVYQSGSGDRLEHLFHHSIAVKKLWQHPQILQLLSAIFDDVAVPCQTLNFLHGSEQAFHQDAIHLTPFPEGYMCGVWVALEDIKPESGPLVIYPGSHRLPTLYAKTVGIEKQNQFWDQHLVNEYVDKYLPTLESYLNQWEIEPEYYTPAAGSVLIWHSNLVHGGSPRQQAELTRRSMVSHYFARGAIAFYDTTGTVGYKHQN